MQDPHRFRIIGSRGGPERGILRLLELSPFIVAGIAVVVLVPANIWLKVFGTAIVAGLGIFRAMAETKGWANWIQAAVPVIVALLIGLLTIISGETILYVLAFFNCLRVAFTGDRRILNLTLIATLVALAVPALIHPEELGAPAIIWMVVLPAVSLPVQARSRSMLESAGLNSRLAGVLSDLLTSNDARRSIVDSAHNLGDADIAVIFEVDSSGDLRATAGYGVDSNELVVLSDDMSAVGLSITGRETVFAPYVETVEYDLPPGMNGRDIKSLISCPITQNGIVIGALCAGWKERMRRADFAKPSVIKILADEAATTMAHSDLLQNLTDRATRDPLTGLANRRAWDRMLRATMRDSGHSNEPLSIAVLDLDHFKKFNDNHGHQAGDRMLRETAAAWKSALRKNDLLFRWGGEEFTVILPDCEPAQSLEVVERLRTGTLGTETSSAGVATWDGEETPQEFFARADAALYVAKETGRNRTVTAAPIDV